MAAAAELEVIPEMAALEIIMVTLQDLIRMSVVRAELGVQAQAAMAEAQAVELVY
tara:strand:- start:194 stop:358 length:165 start_codon:yes stop_codon:yes gene_type:complete